MPHTKGSATRLTILLRARKVFNRKGLFITKETMAKEMKLPISRIFNHFPTKESLLLSIAVEYENALASYLGSLDWSRFDFPQYADILSDIMDIEYEYRSAIVYSILTKPYENEFKEHVQSSYKKSLDTLKGVLDLLISKKLLLPKVLDADNFNVLSYQYVSLLTTWMVHFQMYQSKESYPHIKPYYLKGALGLYKPYMTRKGLDAFDKIDFDKYRKSNMK